MGVDSGSELFKSTSPITAAIGVANARRRIENSNKILIDAATEAKKLEEQKLLGATKKRIKLLNRLSGQ